MATERLKDFWLVGTTWWQGCGALLLQDNCFCKAMAVSQAFIFHFKCYSILHFAVCQLLCSAFFLPFRDVEIHRSMHWQDFVSTARAALQRCVYIFLFKRDLLPDTVDLMIVGKLIGRYFVYWRSPSESTVRGIDCGWMIFNFHRRHADPSVKHLFWLTVSHLLHHPKHFVKHNYPPQTGGINFRPRELC